MSDQDSHTEAVLAFIYETKTWRDMDTDERLAWCQRVAHVLSGDSAPQFGEWSQSGLAPILGIDQSTLSYRLSWSRKVSESGDHSRGYMARSPEQWAREKAGRARQFFADGDTTVEAKRDLIAELAIRRSAVSTSATRQRSACSAIWSTSRPGSR